MRRSGSAALAIFLLCLSEAALAQGPSKDWRTLSTDRYRVHYAAPYETWARYVAERLESIRSRVDAAVGYAPPQIIDVLVQDPEADTNGSAWPFLARPRMVLWTTPPAQETVLRNFRSWPEVLAIHEQAHLSHLLRPSRDAWTRWLGRLGSGLGPVTWKSPRWVIEGYATLLEGQLTGSGRPFGDFRAALLRRWAQMGRLPSYGAMASDPEGWMGMSMAYLAGSAYLEWLQARAGEDSLRKLWARMTARTDRSFEEAFSGVFGDAPDVLYGRFKAELTASAMAVEGQVPLQQGELWQRLEWSTGGPAVSPDGSRLALVLRERHRPGRLVVWDTASDPKALEEWHSSNQKRLASDPQDVEPVLGHPLPREARFTLPAIHGAAPEDPRWMSDGQGLLFTRFEMDREGFLHPDLFVWSLETGQVRRVTRLADVRDADPAPGGAWAVAVRCRFGLSQLVRVDLASGAVEELTPPSVDTIYDHPRISPDGRTLAMVRHKAGEWKLLLRTVEGGQERELPTPPGVFLAHPAWMRDGKSILASVGSHGFIDVWQFPVGTEGRALAWTRVPGGALAPEPTSDGTAAFFLSLEPHGFDLRRIEWKGEPPEAASFDARLAPAIPPVPERLPEALQIQPLGKAERYGLGRQEPRLMPSGHHGPGSEGFEMMLRSGDLVGRLETLMIAVVGDRPRGLAVAAKWRGWPVELGLHAFAAETDRERRGLELELGWEGKSRSKLLRLTAGGALAHASGLEDGLQRALFGDLKAEWRHGRGRTWASAELGLHGEAGKTGADPWTRSEAALGLSLGAGGSWLAGSWRKDWAGGADSDVDRLRLGGLPSSVLPAGVRWGRIEEAALPEGGLRGDSMEAQRLESNLGVLPVPLFLARFRAEDGAWLRAVGAEIRFSLPPMPIVKVPATEVRAGIARTLDAPLEDRTQWWIGTSWRP